MPDMSSKQSMPLEVQNDIIRQGNFPSKFYGDNLFIQNCKLLILAMFLYPHVADLKYKKR
jgi:hypothetical protein